MATTDMGGSSPTASVKPARADRTVWSPRLFFLQRASAMVLAPLVLIHIGLMLYAVGDGLTAGEILARTRGNWLWGLFYSLFVVAAATHAPIGMRNVMREWLPVPGRLTDLLCVAFGLLLLVLGARAVYAVVFAPAIA